MKRLKLRSYVIPSVSAIALIVVALISIVNMNATNKYDENLKNIDYVTNTILDNEIAVINDTSTKMINPYTDQNVTIGKYFYNYKGEANQQEKSIIYHNDTYLQNSGIDFISQNPFDVVSVLNGTVANVSENETLGKIVEISHDNALITIYQSLSEVNVNIDDQVLRGQIIGKSGDANISTDLNISQGRREFMQIQLPKKVQKIINTLQNNLFTSQGNCDRIKAETRGFCADKGAFYATETAYFSKKLARPCRI